MCHRCGTQALQPWAQMGDGARAEWVKQGGQQTPNTWLCLHCEELIKLQDEAMVPAGVRGARGEVAAGGARVGGLLALCAPSLHTHTGACCCAHRQRSAP